MSSYCIRVSLNYQETKAMRPYIKEQLRRAIREEATTDRDIWIKVLKKFLLELEDKTWVSRYDGRYKE